MRMWMVDPKIMCRKHLLGEHVELHMLVGCLVKGKSVRGFINGGLVELHNIEARHNELVTEMQRRGYKHKSPLTYKGDKIGFINIENNIKQLIGRCPNCSNRYANIKTK